MTSSMGRCAKGSDKLLEIISELIAKAHKTQKFKLLVGFNHPAVIVAL